MSVGVWNWVSILVRNVLSVEKSGTPQFCHLRPLALAELLHLPLHLQLLKGDLLLVDNAHHRLCQLAALLKDSPDTVDRLWVVGHKITVQLFEILSEVWHTFVDELGPVGSCKLKSQCECVHILQSKHDCNIQIKATDSGSELCTFCKENLFLENWSGKFLCNDPGRSRREG